MRQIKKWVKSLPEDMIITKLDVTLMVTIGFLAGMIIGIMTSPKGYKKIGCDNGNNNHGEMLQKEEEK